MMKHLNCLSSTPRATNLAEINRICYCQASLWY